MNDNLLKKFKEYVYKFDMNDIGISRKYYHSLRVMDIANLIAINENFSNKDIELSKIVGLLHDYARFPQWTDYKTYNDMKSIDHGDLAVELLFDNNEIEKFNINKEYYDEIYDSIKYHNKYDYPNDMSEHNKLLCKLIRDADKLDIFYLYGMDKFMFLEDSKNISTVIKDCFYNNKPLDINKVKSRNDRIIYNLGMVYDINFYYSFKYLKDNKLIEKMYDRLKNKELFKEYFYHINKYIDERIDKYVR